MKVKLNNITYKFQMNITYCGYNIIETIKKLKN